MSRHGLPVPPAPAEIDSLFVAVKEYQRQQSFCGSIRTQRWGSVDVHCKLSGSLILHHTPAQTFSWFSPLCGTFHTGIFWAEMEEAEARCHRYIAALQQALDNSQFYRVCPAREVIPELAHEGDILLWRLGDLFLQCQSETVRVPLSASCSSLLATREWRTCPLDCLQVVLARAEAQTAIREAQVSLARDHEEKFWACVSCQRASAPDLKSALVALYRLQIYDYLQTKQGYADSWSIGPQESTFGETTPLLQCKGYPREHKTARVINTLLEGIDARFRLTDYLHVTTHEKSKFIYSLPQIWWDAGVETNLPQMESWTAHDKMEAICSWTHLVRQLARP